MANFALENNIFNLIKLNHMKMKQKITFLLTALMCLSGTSAWALEQDADGIYQIGTAEDLVAFAELVNGGG